MDEFDIDSIRYKEIQHLISSDPDPESEYFNLRRITEQYADECRSNECDIDIIRYEEIEHLIRFHQDRRIDDHDVQLLPMRIAKEYKEITSYNECIYDTLQTRHKYGFQCIWPTKIDDPPSSLRADSLFYPVHYSENNSILLIGQLFVTEYDILNNYYHESIMFPDKIPFNNNHKIEELSASLDMNRNILFVTDKYECNAYKLTNDKISKKLKNVSKIFGGKYSNKYRKCELCFISSLNEMHLIADDQHFKFDNDQNKFIKICILPTYSPKIVYLESMKRIMFFGGESIISDDEDIIYFSEITDDNSLITKQSKFTLPHKDKDFIVIGMFGHIIFLFYYFMANDDYDEITFRNYGEIWMIDFLFNKQIRIQYGQTNWRIDKCLGIQINDDIIHFMRGKRSYYGYYVRRAYHSMMHIDDILLPQIKLDYKYKYKALVMGHSKCVERKCKLFSVVPDYLSKLILSYFTKWA